MNSTKDYVIELGELVEKWFPELEWDDIMDIVTSDNIVSQRAKEIVRRRMEKEKA